MNQKTWKIIAIIFISLFIFETLFVWYAWSLGKEIINNEEVCAYEICDLDNDKTLYDSYAFSYDTCLCYNNHQVVYTKKITGG